MVGRRSGQRSGWWIVATPLGFAVCGGLLGAAVGAAHGPDPSGDFLAFSRSDYAIVFAVAFAAVGLGIGLLVSTAWVLHRWIARRSRQP
jgi:hypothetical protein